MQLSLGHSQGNDALLSKARVEVSPLKLVFGLGNEERDFQIHSLLNPQGTVSAKTGRSNVALSISTIMYLQGFQTSG